MTSFVPAIANENPFAITHLPMFSGEVSVSRSVFNSFRDCRGKPATRIGFTKKNIHNCMSHFLSAKPDLHHSRHIIGPRHVDWCSGIDKHDGLFVYCGDCSNQFNLTTGKIESVTIMTFAFPIISGANDNKCNIAFGSEFNCPTYGIVLFDKLQSNLCAMSPLLICCIAFKDEFMWLTSDEINDCSELNASHTKE